MTWRIGIIGAGAIARDHIQAFAGIPGITVAQVVDRHPERAEALARLAGNAAAGIDLEGMLRDPSIDAIDICTSPDSHAAITIAAARAGKAIHLEKPIALRPDEVEPMLEAVAQAGVPFLLGQTTRFQPVHLEIADAIEAGTIGTPRAMHLSLYAGHLWPGGWRAWQLQIERCGGHLVHNGIHAIDLATWLMGSTPIRVFARGMKTFSPGMPTPDSFHVILRFKNGAIATLEWSYALRRRGDMLRRIAVFGEDGTLHHSTQGELDIHSDAARPVAIGTLNAFDRQMRHFADVLDGAAPIVTPEQIRGAFAAAHAAQESCASGRAIEINTPAGEGSR
jgi:predicted dehydrogenase